jgi:hypothetical protein
LRSELKASDDGATRSLGALTLSLALLSFVVLDGVLVDVESMLKLHFLGGGELKFIISKSTAKFTNNRVFEFLRTT